MRKIIATILISGAIFSSSAQLPVKLNNSKNKSNSNTEVKESPDKKVIGRNYGKTPTTEYSDSYGVSGIYYLSRDIYSNWGSSKIYFSKVNLQLSEEDVILYIHFDEGKSAKAYINGFVSKQFKAKTLEYLNFEFTSAGNGGVQEFSKNYLAPLEKDVYLINIDYSVYTNKDCEPKLEYQKDAQGNIIRNYLILGKNQERVKELLNNPAEVDSLYSDSFVKRCEMITSIKMADTPMPKEGIKDANLKAEANNVMQARLNLLSKNTNTLQYTYISGSEWKAVRNQNTGIILGRTIEVVAVYTTPSGRCQWGRNIIRQDYDGTNYGSSYWNGVLPGVIPVDCKDAYKYK
jgi:hypothetical protein